MDLAIDPATIELTPGRPARLTVAAGRRITSIRGTVWITIDGDPRDVVLEPGETHVFDRVGRVVVQALDGRAQLVGEEGIEIDANRPARSGAKALRAFWSGLRGIA